MAEIPPRARKRFEKLALELSSGDSRKLPYREGMGTGSFFVGKKMFGVLGEDGSLILKLDPVRVAQLITEGVGRGWHPGSGKPLREYVAISLSQEPRWLGLARESRAFMAGKG